jgi:hypothetical protein
MYGEGTSGQVTSNGWTIIGVENDWRRILAFDKQIGRSVATRDCVVGIVRHMPTSWLTLALLLLMLEIHANAQTDQLLPEVDAYYKLKSNPRLLFQAKETREGGEPVSAELGPSIDFYMKPWIKLKNVTAFDLDDSKGRPVIFSIGYRYLPSPSAPSKNRLEPYVTFNFPVKGGLLLSDKNRADLDWQSGKFNWQYRNRIELERTVKIRSYHLSPYVSVELFYQSQYEKWSDTAIYAGALFPIGKRVELNTYYEHQNSTGKRPNQQLNQLGLVLSVHF